MRYDSVRNKLVIYTRNKIHQTFFETLPFSSVKYAAGSLSPELGGAGGEEDEQFLHHGADVGGRHQSQGQLQSTPTWMGEEDQRC